MYPAYGYIDPYFGTLPHQMEPNSYPYQHPPMKGGDPCGHPWGFVPSRFNDTPCQPNPGDHSGCCQHSCCFPGYYHNLRPQFSHVQPAPPVYYYCGPHPPYYPDAYPPYFFRLPQHDTVDDQAQYHNYDDKARGVHCCGCPKHAFPLPRRGDSGSSPPKISIEEQKPEGEQELQDSSGLIRLPPYNNPPSPAMRVPASSIKEDTTAVGDKAAQLMYPRYWKGWMPWGDLINSLKGSSMQDAEGKKGQQDEEDKRAEKQLPFPIIWMPGRYDMPAPEGAAKDLKEAAPPVGAGAAKDWKEAPLVEDWPSKFKIIPGLKLLENDRSGEMPKVVGEEPATDEAQPESPMQMRRVTKTIPVREVEESHKAITPADKQEEKDSEKRGTTSSEKLKEECSVEKASSKKKNESSSSKLPPLCLRVDPLPKKKANGSSRSPGPPGHKDESNHHQHQHQQKEEQSPQRESRKVIAQKVIPVLTVKDTTANQPNKEHKCQQSASAASLKDFVSAQGAASSDKSLEAKDGSESRKTEERCSEEKMSASDAESNQKIEANKRHSEPLEESKESQNDAAVKIQTAYRGYDVRRWHPLEKLRKIAKVRERAGNVRRQIESLEDSSRGGFDAKQKVVIGETLMGLLLELDAIQGLHPSLREARKSVANELVCLHEKLDSLGKQTTKGRETTTNVEEDSKSATYEAKTIGEAAFVGVGAGEDQSSRVESLPLNTNSLNSTATKEAAEGEGHLVDLLRCNEEEAVNDASSSLSREPNTEPEVLLPAGVNKAETRQSIQSEENERPNIVSPFSLVSELISDQGVKLSSVTEVPSVLGLPPKESSSSESSFAANKECHHEHGSNVDMARKGEPAAESDGSTNAEAVLVRDVPCAAHGSSDAEVGSLSSGGGASRLDVEGLLEEPIGGSESQQLEAAAVDHGAKDDDITTDSKMEEPEESPLQACEQGRDVQHRGMQEADMGKKLASLACELMVPVQEANGSELAIACPQPKGASQYAKEQVPLVPAISGDYHVDASTLVENVVNKDMSSPELGMKAAKVTETVLEGLDTSGGLTRKETEMELKVPREDAPITDEPLSVGEDAILVTEGHNQVAGREVERTLNNADEVSLVSGAISKAVKHPHPNVECCSGLTSTGAAAARNQEEKNLLEENEKLREMLEMILDAGKEQLGVVASLNGRVKDLERKLAQRRKIKVKRKKTT